VREPCGVSRIKNDVMQAPYHFRILSELNPAAEARAVDRTSHPQPCRIEHP
jgi:hypothetical protein